MSASEITDVVSYTVKANVILRKNESKAAQI